MHAAPEPSLTGPSTRINESLAQGPGFDAQRSAANTNDLRGKLLRIRVRPNGTYTSPAGNLFPEAQDHDGKTRPEIFLMGLRNPFRFDVDSSGMVYVGDCSPDSRVPNPARGPEGTGRWFATGRAGNYGWPYCYSPSLPLPRLRLRHPHLRAGVQLRRAGQRLLPQHRPDGTAGGGATAVLVHLRGAHPVPRRPPTATGFFRPNPDAQLAVIRYVKGTRSPVAVMDAAPTSGTAPLTVRFSSAGTPDPDPGESVSLAWGVYTVKFTVTDSSGKTAVLTCAITVGNTAPTVTVTAPVAGSLFTWGATVPFSVAQQHGAARGERPDRRIVTLRDLSAVW